MPEIIDKFTSNRTKYSLVKIDENKYCVMKEYRGFFGPVKQFSCTTLNGTDIFTDLLAASVSIDTLERTRYIFNALKLQYGEIE